MRNRDWVHRTITHTIPRFVLFRLLELCDLLVQQIVHVGIVLLYVLEHHLEIIEAFLVAGSLADGSTVLAARILLQAALLLINTLQLFQVMHIISPPNLVTDIANGGREPCIPGGGRRHLLLRYASYACLSRAATATTTTTSLLFFFCIHVIAQNK